MRYRWSHRRLLAAAVSSLCLCGAALADDTANLSVKATVTPSCQLTTAPTLGFGTLTPLANNDAQADITWVCTKGFNTVIKLGGGGAGNIAARAMSGTATLPYQLYTSAARTTIFGDGTTGNTMPVSGAGYSAPGIVTVYGRVLQANAGAAPAGAYSDTVQITIVF
ncbi:MAG TPA: spore coat protein U domain-containing protein [Gammaproteobacteria bacterium]|nr:spore coat protein U domain-containing protein [Gammaproteobacteria bacterium]